MIRARGPSAPFSGVRHELFRLSVRLLGEVRGADVFMLAPRLVNRDRRRIGQIQGAKVGHHWNSHG